MTTIFIILAGLITGLCIVLVQMSKAQKAEIAEMIDSWRSSDLAWEEGQNDMQELYEAQLLTAQEKIWKFEDVIDDRDEQILQLQSQIGELREALHQHDNGCLLPFGEYELEGKKDE